MTTIVYYNILPHPAGKSKEVKRIYLETHFNENEDVLVMKRTFFQTYYKKVLSLKGNIKLDIVFSQLQDYETNSLATSGGQAMLKKKKVRHTTMMVGDMIKKNNRLFVVTSRSFRPVRLV